MAYHEDIPLIRHDVTGWEPIADQAAARAVPLEQVRRAGAAAMVVGTMKAARRTCRANWPPGAQAGGGGGALMAARVRHRQNRLIVRSFSGRCPSRRTITRSPLRHDGVENATLFSPLQPRQ